MGPDYHRARNIYLTASMLNQASALLREPGRFELPIEHPRECLESIDYGDLERAMLELEGIARHYGAKSGFWRYIQQPARRMNLQAKVEEYECEFHKALARSKQ